MQLTLTVTVHKATERLTVLLKQATSLAMSRMRLILKSLVCWPLMDTSRFLNFAVRQTLSSTLRLELLPSMT